jgi:hypothetical protein
MYLSRFGVKNYKCLGEIDIPLTPIHVLIGQNDCGKTSLLEAMEAFFATSEKELKDVFPQPWTGRELVRHGSPEARIDLRGEWTTLTPDDTAAPYSSFQYGLSMDFPLRDHRTCVETDSWIEANGRRRPLSVKGEPSPAAHLEHWADDRKAVSSALKPAQKYAFDAKQMALPAVFDPARQFRLETDGFGLATLLDDIVGFDPKIFLTIQEEFCRLFPQFRSLRIKTEYAVDRYTQSDGLDGVDTSSGQSGPSGPFARQTQSYELPQSSVGTGKGIYLETQSGETVRARHASDGAILFLGLLALAHLPEPPVLLLLEEPENGVYPTRLRQIIGLLKGMVNRTEGVRFPQIILTTHSPYVLSFFQPEEVTLLSRESDRPDAPVRARPLREAPHVKERMGNDFYLGELWYNLSEEELFGDATCQSRD